MATIITKYSDYIIRPIDYFIDLIKSELDMRDVSGLTDDRIQIINVSKQHPIVTMMANKLSSRETERSNILPAISVTPSNPVEEGFTLGQSFQPEIIDDDFIAVLKAFLAMADKDIQKEVLITKNQIELILAAYKRAEPGGLRAEVHEWRKNDEINISLWSETPDIDMLIGNVMDSLFADLQVGFAGDNSEIHNMKWRVTKGLTNFNFGRVLFGTEYSLTFMNTYNNYTIYSDNVIDGHDFVGTFEISGEE
jgi:hypothetical protein